MLRSKENRVSVSPLYLYVICRLMIYKYLFISLIFNSSPGTIEMKTTCNQ